MKAFTALTVAFCNPPWPDASGNTVRRATNTECLRVRGVKNPALPVAHDQLSGAVRALGNSSASEACARARLRLFRKRVDVNPLLTRETRYRATRNRVMAHLTR